MSGSQRLWRASVVALLGLGILTAAPQAQRKQPLPEASVKAHDGKDVALAALSQDAQWLLLYVGGADSTASTRLLEALAKWDLGEALTRVVIVVGDTADIQTAARLWADRLPGAQWYGDPAGNAGRALKLRGAPTLIGARGPSVEWVLAGVLNDPTMLRDVVRSWVTPRVLR